MALCYLDSSALLKRYIAEAGSRWVSALIDKESVAISELALAEVASGFGRRMREGTLGIRQRDALFRRFLVETEGYTVSALTRSVVERAATTLLRGVVPGRLRTLDALHLASAETVFSSARERGVELGHFVSADRVLLQAARGAGLPTANPEDYP